MVAAFGVCAAGLTLGMLYTLYECLLRHRDQWSVLSASILYYKFLGALGILGMLLFLAFLFSVMSEKRH